MCGALPRSFFASSALTYHDHATCAIACEDSPGWRALAKIIGAGSWALGCRARSLRRGRRAPPLHGGYHDARELSCEPTPMSMPTGVRPHRQPGAGEATRIEAEIETRVCRHAPLPSSNMSPLMSQPGSRPRSTETDTLRRGGARCRALTRPASSRSSSWLEVCGGLRTGPRVQVAAGHSHLL